ncbi:type II secretion system protein N [Hydrogenophaga sp. 5NK40-0174]|uniref:type II secretion system protein N n=1 Tax=Hydrogenophaga sp. 5NK40-0174 TaxID=3127649 RepID=UPI0031060153
MSPSFAFGRHTGGMLTSGQSSGWPAALAALLWLLVALSATYWGLRWAGRSEWTPVNTSLQSPVEANPVAVAMLLDSTPADAPEAEAPVVQTRLALMGLVNQRGEEGAALIAIDDKPPRPYRVGSVVADGLILRSVSAQGVRLSTEDNARELELDMPKPPQKPLLPF